MAKIAQLDIKIGVDGSGVDSGLQQAINAVSNAQSSATARLGGAMQRLGGDMMRAGGVLTAGLTVPIVGFAAAGMMAAREFNTGMANVASLIPGNAERVRELKASVQDMAVAVGKSTTDLAGGLYQVISAFGDTAQTADLLRINAKAAAAGVATTTEAIDLTSAVTLAYGDTSAAAVQKVADLALLAVRMGKTTFPELAGSIGRVTPMARVLGVSQEELFAVMGSVTGVTGRAAEVATQLRSALKSLANPTAGMTEALKAMGYSSGQAMIQQLGMGGALQRIAQYAKETGTPLQKLVSDIEGQTILLPLADTLASRYANTLQAMGQAAGTTDEAFQAQTTGVNAAGYALQQLSARSEVFRQNIGDAIAPALIAAMEAAQPLVNSIARLAVAFAAMPPGAQATILGIAGAVATLGPALMVVGGAISGIGSIVKVVPLIAALIGPMLASLGAAVSGAATGFLALIGPVGWVVLAIAAVASAIMYLWRTNESFRVALTTAWTAISTAVAGAALSIWTALTSAFTSVGVVVAQFFARLPLYWESLRQGVTAAALTVQTTVSAAFAAVSTFFLTVWTAAYTWGVGLFKRFADGIMVGFQWVKDRVTQAVQWVRNLLPGSDAKEGPLSDLYASGRALMSTLAGGISAAGGMPAAAVAGAASGLFSTLPAGLGIGVTPQLASLGPRPFGDGSLGVTAAMANSAINGRAERTQGVRVWVDNGNIRAEMVETARGVYRVEQSYDDRGL
jgi:TP901 family phage tail tape measure protein